MFRFIRPDETHKAALHDIVGHAFGIVPEDVGRWFERAGQEHVRAFVRGSAVVGGLLEIPMAQYFGGRSVSTLGVAGVAVATSERGRGVGAQMMVEMLRGAKMRGFALSSLYPASITLYRRAGYERAGARFAIELDPRHFEIARETTITIAEVEGLPDELRALYTRSASRTPGYLDRGPYMWGRIVNPRGMTTKTFSASHDGKLEGFVVLAHVNANGFPTYVNVLDMAATTPRAARAILRLLVEYRSLADKVKWAGGTNDLFANLLPERHAAISLIDYFMVRIVDVARAFQMRGYPRGATGFVTLELTDASMPENSGRYALSLADGAMRVTPGGIAGPTVRVDERGLSALYTGFSQAHVLADAGWLTADEDAQSLLDSWLAGPLPTMRDHF